MNDDLLNILSNSNKDIDNQKLMDYLSGSLSSEDKHEFEKALTDSDLISDAVEGLGQLSNKKSLDYAEQLNRNLKQQLLKKKLAKGKRRLKDIPWLYFSIVLLIIIILIGFFVIWKYLE